MAKRDLQPPYSNAQQTKLIAFEEPIQIKSDEQDQRNYRLPDIVRQGHAAHAGQNTGNGRKHLQTL